MPDRLRGLYVITDPNLIPDAELATRVAAAIRGGAFAVQYRDKRTDHEGHLQRARTLRRVTRDLGALLIINDDPRLAAEVDADGIHLGRDDPDLESARAVVGSRLIGVSCYNDFQCAVDAERRGADYVAFGSFFPTRTKSGTVPASAQLLRRARRELSVPVVAIGGITPDNGAALVEAGADMLAVAGAVFGAADPRRAAERFKPLMKASPAT
ncbi:MAG TPA: thiamine phosphate synthase [Arenicellales bacterium]|nr:thiamine phosphate synthase [Arenicellales bacterium]